MRANVHFIDIGNLLDWFARGSNLEYLVNDAFYWSVYLKQWYDAGALPFTMRFCWSRFVEAKTFGW